MTDPASLYVPDGDGFLPTGLTRTGWEDEAQHGGPPAGLLAHVLEAAPPEPSMRVVRLTVDLMRRVPLERLTAVTRPVRAGRRIHVADAELRSGGETVARATALWVRITELGFSEHSSPAWRPPRPPEELSGAESPPWEGGNPELHRFHRHAVEIRPVDGSWPARGRGTSWVRLRYPVVEGSRPSSFVRTAALADIANGNAVMLDPSQWAFINPDITVGLHRPPKGEWLGMKSRAAQHPDGIGMADTLLFDRDGPVGRVVQSQILMNR